MQAWKGDYPWLHLAFRHIGPGGRTASEGWRVRIEEGLETTLDYKVRGNGTATVWCGLSGFDFHHEPTPKELLEGLADAYRREVKRVGGQYPTRAGTWKMSPALAADAEAAPESPDAVAVATRYGTVELSSEARKALVNEIERRGNADAVVHALAGADASMPVELDREGKIVVFAALWALAERTGPRDVIDPELRLLQDRLRDEIAEGPAIADPPLE